VLLAEDPDLFIYGGDNVYGDIRKDAQGKPIFLNGDMGRLKETYETLARVPGFQAMRARAPILPTWDDHDYGANDAGAEFPQRLEAEALFLDFWQVPAEDARRQREGVYFARSFGPAGRRVQVIMLDLRSFRGPLTPTDQEGAPGQERYVPNPDPALTILGPAQWRWLEEALREPAELRLLVSSIQVIAEGHGWERWGLLPAERERLYQLLVKSQARNTILLSGDRHRGALYRVTPAVEGAWPLYELTSSSLNLSFGGQEEPGPHRVGASFTGENYGLIDIDWARRAVTLRLRDMNRKDILTQEVSLSP
jgi:alkaline phosphatase D